MKTLYLTGIALLVAATAVQTLTAQISVYPQQLYPGENVVTIESFGGIRAIKPMLGEDASKFVDIENLDEIEHPKECPGLVELKIRVNTVTTPCIMYVDVSDCNGRKERFRFINKIWRVDVVVFPEVKAGDTICRPFQISLNAPITLGGNPIGVGAQEYLDSVSFTIPQAHAQFSFPPPIAIKSGSTYRYQVCFSADRPGDYRFPVRTWIRRIQPAGGYTNYIVADTGIVRVLPNPEVKALRRLQPVLETVPDESSTDSTANRATEEPESGTPIFAPGSPKATERRGTEEKGRSEGIPDANDPTPHRNMSAPSAARHGLTSANIP